VCGHRSFAAQGLPESLNAAGHDVVCFSRGSLERNGNLVTGPVETMHENPHLSGPFDAAINYIFLAGEPVKPNLRYISSLLEFCRSRSVPHLVHISSVSAYRSSLRFVDERAPIENDPTRKGVYGSLKAATDEYIQQNAPPGLKVSMVRPAFILAPGLKSPIAGNGVRLPWGKLLVIGNPHSQFPLTTRHILNSALLRVVEEPPAGLFETLLVADSDSPSRKSYLAACCRELGTGQGLIALPAIVWLGAVWSAALAERVLGRTTPKLLNRVPRLRIQTAQTEARLGMSLRFNWRSALRDAVGNQTPNYQLPHAPVPFSSIESERSTGVVTFVGFGRIVRTRHLPALKSLDFSGTIDAYDLVPGEPTDGVVLKPLTQPLPRESDLYVVASPGPAHVEAIALLDDTFGPVLVEKPLAYSHQELEAWKKLADSRPARVVACHNYRFKANVQEMLSLMRRYNAGKLRHVHVHFESAPVANEVAVWMRDERKARTLLMDYAINLLDVACMFGVGEWKARDVRYECDARGQTSLIDGSLVGDSYPVSFLLRQGFGIRMARILFNFQNYDISLGFFPDTCVAYMANDNPVTHLSEARSSAVSTYRKVLERLNRSLSDRSHAEVIASAMAGSNTTSGELASAISVDRVAPFYRGMFEVAAQVYGSGWPARFQGASR
jgi:nucleoside-diphosphate-sugar epimerase